MLTKQSNDFKSFIPDQKRVTITLWRLLTVNLGKFISFHKTRYGTASAIEKFKLIKC